MNLASMQAIDYDIRPAVSNTLVEDGFAWLPALCWRLGNHSRKLRSEVPFLQQRLNPVPSWQRALSLQRSFRLPTNTATW